MGRNRTSVSEKDIIKIYKECGSIKKTAKLSHASNTTILTILEKHEITKNNIGNKLVTSDKEVKRIVNLYTKDNLTVDDISKRVNIKSCSVRKILKDNNITLKKKSHATEYSNGSRINVINNLIEILEKNNIGYERNFKIDNVKTNLRIGKYCIDFLTCLSLAADDIYENRLLLKNKKLKLASKGLLYIPIFEDEYKDKKNIVLNKLQNILGVLSCEKKIPARKCSIKPIYMFQAKNFLEENHIQGHVNSSLYLGAFYEGELVAVMLFTREEDDKWNLTRFAGNIEYKHQGVAGKMFSYFLKEYNPSEIRSFADCRWTLDKKNNIYTILGFDFDYTTDPGYTFYEVRKNYHRKRREQFKKSTLVKKYGFSMTMTESEMVKALGYTRIWDCGLFKYVWHKNKENVIDEVTEG